MTVPAVASDPVDAARVRSFIGLVVARLGPRAYGLVSGTFLALLVGSHTESLFAVTFALTAHRIVSLATYPLVGRWSDSAHSAIGRRTPYMAGGLAVMGVCTFLLPEVDSYWVLVGLLVVARQARIAYTLPNIAATPEVFGRSRWIRALVTVGAGGLLVGTLVRATVIATWERDDPTTWAPAFRIAAFFMLLGAVAIVFLVREAPASKQVEPAPREPWLQQLRELLAVPNARVIGGTLLILLAASGATDRAYPIYAQEVLGASGSDLAAMGFIAGPVTFIVAIPVGLWMGGRFTRRQLAVFAPIGGMLGAFAHYFITTLWQSVLIGVITTPLLVACVVSMGPFAASLVSHSGGLTERIGVVLGPIGLVGITSSYAAALTYDHLIHDYRVIWLFSGLLTGAVALVLVRLRVPPGQERADVTGMLRDLADVAKVHRARNAKLFSGEVTREDTDTTDFAEAIRRVAARYGFDDGTPDGPSDAAPAPGTVP